MGKVTRLDARRSRTGVRPKPFVVSVPAMARLGDVAALRALLEDGMLGAGHDVFALRRLFSALIGRIERVEKELARRGGAR